MEVIGERNNITTECGHQFHASCIMTNVSRNGFNCPCCRTAMAEYENDDEDDYTVDDEDDDEDDNFLETIHTASDLPDVVTMPIEEVVSQVLSSDIATEDFIRYILYDAYGYGELQEVYEEVSNQIENIVESLNRDEDETHDDDDADEDEDETQDEDDDEDLESVDTHDDDDENWCKRCSPHHYAECGSPCRDNYCTKSTGGRDIVSVDWDRRELVLRPSTCVSPQKTEIVMDLVRCMRPVKEMPPEISAEEQEWMAAIRELDNMF
jgi:hypothetical protein